MVSIDGNLRYPPREEEQQNEERRNVSEEHFHSGTSNLTYREIVYLGLLAWNSFFVRAALDAITRTLRHEASIA